MGSKCRICGTVTLQSDPAFASGDLAFDNFEPRKFRRIFGKQIARCMESDAAGLGHLEELFEHPGAGAAFGFRMDGQHIVAIRLDRSQQTFIVILVGDTVFADL